MDHDAARGWLRAYVSAWKSYDPDAIGALFTEDAIYHPTPFDEPIQGRAAIIRSWLENRDAPGRYEATYDPIVIDGDLVIANGRTRYDHTDGRMRQEYDNLFVLRFDANGRCRDYREWYMERPDKSPFP
jgi:ketosteroid isomerase-like protein